MILGRAARAGQLATGMGGGSGLAMTGRDMAPARIATASSPTPHTAASRLCVSATSSWRTIDYRRADFTRGGP
jgi:hypothetical protein